MGRGKTKRRISYDKRFGGAGRGKQLVVLCKQHDFHFICLQETIKYAYRSRDLNSFSRGLDFAWSWIASNGHSSGLLMGVDKEVMEVVNEEKGVFCHSLELKNTKDTFHWRLFNVYGPVQDNRKVHKLTEMIFNCQLPLIVGGDFNMIRRVEDKSSGNVNAGWMQAFNDMIENTALTELQGVVLKI